MLFRHVLCAEAWVHWPKIPCVQFCKDGKRYYCDAPVPAHLLANFRAREDGQIMGLEILAIALGAS